MSLTLVAPVQTMVGQRIAVKEVTCNSLLHPLAYGSSRGYTVNLYKGCTHGCTYCYAPSLTHDERRWGTYVDAKVNAPQVLETELRGLRKDEVFFSSASDPYQPIEARYRLTRRCLEVLSNHNFPVSILTRSPLVLRDINLLRRLEWVRVGMSITSIPLRRYEPGVPPLQRRLETLSKLAESGLKTWVSLAPVVPALIRVDLDDLFERFSKARVGAVSYGILRFNGYEESREMFEHTAGMTSAEALAGKEKVESKLASLIRKHGLEDMDMSRGWEIRQRNEPSLDDYYQRETQG